MEEKNMSKNFVTKIDLLKLNVTARNLYHGVKMKILFSMLWNFLNSVAVITIFTYLLLK